MSYQVLARKWRPKNFATLVGQEHVVRALTHALDEQRLHHAYLLTGTRGTGKTTIARILAKSLNCESGVSSTPCGHCSTCQEIDVGRFVDLLEVDAATNTKVEEMRQLLENAIYAPTQGRYKIYVIDEVHMLSTSAFNAMLKTLEEPPEHIKFILATTDPQKIPVTVLSRCLQFNLKQMPPAVISTHLNRVLQAEGIPSTPPALARIAHAADGSMRDALSLLDQAIAHGAGKLETDEVEAMLGTVASDYLYDILEALAAHDAGAMLKVADLMATRSVSFGSALQDMARLLLQLQILQLAPAGLENDDIDLPRLQSLSRRYVPEFVQLAYQIVIQGRHELPQAPDEYAGFCMTLLRLYAFKPLAVGQMPTPTPTAPADLENDQQSTTDTVATQISANEQASSGSVCVADWHQIFPQLKLGGMVKTLAQNCCIRKFDAAHGICQLALDPAAKHLQTDGNEKRLQEALSEYCERPVRLQIETSADMQTTPAQLDAQARATNQRAADDAINSDPFVQEMKESFDATIVEDSVRPI